MAVQIALELVERMHQLAIEQAARCVFICFILVVLIFMLTFIRANEMVTISMCEFFTRIGNRPNCIQGALVGVMLAMGEVTFFGLAVHLLDQVVSLSFFFCLKYVLTLFHTAGLSGWQLCIQAIAGTFLSDIDTQVVMTAMAVAAAVTCRQ